VRYDPDLYVSFAVTCCYGGLLPVRYDPSIYVSFAVTCYYGLLPVRYDPCIYVLLAVTSPERFAVSEPYRSVSGRVGIAWEPQEQETFCPAYTLRLSLLPSPSPSPSIPHPQQSLSLIHVLPVQDTQ
jgi:hypothetical protein